jgi:hypothetical protein
MITIASNYAAADDDARESLKASAIQNIGKRTIAINGRICQKSSKLRIWWPQPSPIRVKAASAADDVVLAVASRGALQLPLQHHPPLCPTMNTVICHASPIEMLQGSAITPTGIAILSMTSRQIKKLATSATGDNGLAAKEKRTRTRNPRMAVIWMKTLRPNPPKRQRVGLARATHSKTQIKGSLSYVPWTTHG